MILGEHKIRLDRWFAEFGGPGFDLPKIAGSYKGKKLIVVADGRCVWDDLERFGCRCDLGRGSIRKDGWDFLTVNKIGEVFPGNIEHWYSNEAELLQVFVRGRRNEYRREFEGPLHIHTLKQGIGHAWPFGGHGSSGLMACMVGIGLGYEWIVICGMPLDDSGHNGEPPWRRTNFIREVGNKNNGGINWVWQVARDHAFAGKVKSMSGRTAEWLGSP